MKHDSTTRRKTCSRARSRAALSPRLQERRCYSRRPALLPRSRSPRPRLDSRSLRPASNMSGGIAVGAGMRTAGAGIGGAGAGIALSMGSTAVPFVIAGLAAGAIVTAPGDGGCHPRRLTDAALPDVLMALASCQRRADFSRPCGARFIGLAASPDLARLALTSCVANLRPQQ
jgi:hypothetical protein